jgi:uncharacterized protein (TIGR02453 family)
MSHITPALFDFLRELKQNNNRQWFQANKARFEQDVKEPLLEFIADFGKHGPELSPHYLAIPKATGGSMFRIYRDVRFSKDKSPYKTAAAVHFRHEEGKNVHAPGFYLHMEPGGVFAGCGIWQPDTQTANKIRSAIAAQPDIWLSAIQDEAFQRAFTLGGDKLKRPPKGFNPEHPLVEVLKRKDFIGSVDLSEGDSCRDDFLARYVEMCKAAGPLMRFPTEAIGLPW